MPYVFQLKNYIVFIYYILYSSLTKLKHFFRVRRLWGELNIATHIIHPPRPVILLEVRILSYYIDFHPLHPCLSISVLLWGRTSTELGLITSQISHFQVFSVQAREYQHTLFVHLLNGVHWNRAMNPKQLAPRHMSIHPSDHMTPIYHPVQTTMHRVAGSPEFQNSLQPSLSRIQVHPTTGLYMNE